jgi:hypothetical protein
MKPRTERNGASWLLLLAAPVAWFAHFSALYGLASFGGTPRFDTVAWALTGFACLAVGAAWYASWRLKRRRGAPQSPADMAAWLALLSLGGILFQSLPLVLTPH